MGGDYPSCYKSPLKSVSIHAPVWGATQTISQRAWTWRRFNPRPRMGGDPWRDGLITVRRRFNPRPRMGGDLKFYQQLKQIQGFNPRPRMGGDVTSPSSPS